MELYEHLSYTMVVANNHERWRNLLGGGGDLQTSPD